MVETPSRFRWLRYVLACAAFTACGRIGYDLEGAEKGVRDSPLGSSQPDARSRKDAAVPDALASKVGSDSSPSTDGKPSSDGRPSSPPPPDAPVTDVMPPRDVSVRDVSLAPDASIADASPPRHDSEAATVYPSCDAPCCCAYDCALRVAPIGSVCAGSRDTAQFGFESGAGGWLLADPTNTVIPGQVSTTTAPTFSGSASLAATLNVPAGTAVYARFRTPSIPLGATVTFHVWVPRGAALTNIQPYVMDARYTWSGTWLPPTDFVRGCWATITVAVPTTFVLPLFEIGVEFRAAAAASFVGTVYVDSVSW